MNRRLFSKYCLFGATSAACSAYLLPSASGSELAGPSIEVVSTIGEWYLQECPQENDSFVLLENVEKQLPGTVLRYESWRLDVSTADVQAACKRDYEHGDTLYVGGWLLARTEARLCALAVVSGTGN